MRGSEPMPMRTFSMSAPTRSAMLAISFMKLILVASMALAAYLVSSAERTSITTKRSRLRVNGSYSARSSSMVRGLSVPTTTRSGFMKSAIAAPSFRNSGFDTTSNSTSALAALAGSPATSSRTLSAVPTGTVRLGHDDGVRRKILADGAGHLHHMAEIGRAVFTGRGADGDQLEQSVLNGLGGIHRELQALRLQIAPDQCLEAGLVDGHLAPRQRGDLGRIHVHADDMIARIGQAGPGDEADVAGTEYGYTHAGLRLETRHDSRMGVS